MADSGAVGIGVIGAGIMGQRLMAAAAGQGAVRVAGAWDPSAEALAAAARAGAPAMESATQVIAASDCVYVATPPATHLHYARLALAAGRAVFLEKPLAVDVDDAAAFVASLSGARVAVNFPFATAPAVEALRGWLEAGVCGAPRGFVADMQFRAWPRPWQQAATSWLDAPAEGGFVREVASHFLFLARRVLGPLNLRSSEVERAPGGPGHGTERRVAARLDAGGLPGRLTGGVMGDADDHNTFLIRGVADIRLRDWSVAERQRPNGEWIPDPSALPVAENRTVVLHRQLAAVAAMTRGEPHPLATCGEAFEVQRVVEAILSGTGAPGPNRAE